MANGPIQLGLYEEPLHAQEAYRDVLGQPSLIDLVGHESPSGGGVYTNEFIDALKQTREGWSAGHEQRELERLRDLQYIQDWKRTEAEKQAAERSDSWMPWEMQSLTSGPAAGVESLGAAVARMVDPEVSNWMVRSTQARSMGMDLGMTADELGETRKWVNDNLYGASRSYTQAALAAATAKFTGGSSFAFMAGGAAASTANDTYVEGLDYGLSPRQSFNLAWKQGAFEAGVMSVFQMVGLGGLEKGLSQSVGHGMWGFLNKEFGKQFLAEMTEEQITTVLQEMTRVATMPEGKYRNAWIGDDGTFETSPMYQALKDTASQTMFMMGGTKLAHGGAEKAWKFMIDPSRNSVLIMPDEVRESFEREYGDLKKEENRQAAADGQLSKYLSDLSSKAENEAELEYWESVAEDEGRDDKTREAARGVASRLDGGDFEATNVGKELLEIITERMGQKVPAESVTSDVVPAPPAAEQLKVEVPQVILQQDPDAKIVGHLDLIPKDADEDTAVRMLSIAKELSNETRNGRDIRFVQTSDPNIKGLYSGDGIYITVPTINKHMKDGVLDQEGMRKAITGTFAHEFTHELKKKFVGVWNRLYKTLADDSKYGKLLEQGKKNFLEQFEAAQGLDVDPYSDYRGEANASRLDELIREESLAYLMDDHFITTGLVSKIAKTDSNAFEMMRDWLRRIRNSLFRDKLYRGMTSVFNEVASDMGIEGIAERPVVDTTKKKSRRKKPRKTAKKSRKHVLKKGLPEWAEEPVADLEKRGSKVVQKNFASNSAVVVTVRTKSGNTKIVILKSYDGGDSLVKKVVSATEKKYDELLDSAVEEAASVEEPAEDSRETIVEAVNDDIEKQYTGVRQGYSDEDVDIESTDIEAFFDAAASIDQRDGTGLYLEEGDIGDIDVDTLMDRELVIKDEDGRYRVSSIGMRIMSWEPSDTIGEFSEMADEDYDDRWSLGSFNGLDEIEIEEMGWATLNGEMALRNSPHEGKVMDLIKEIWSGNERGQIVRWLRENDSKALKKVVDSVWSKEYNALLKEADGELVRFVDQIRKRMLSGKRTRDVKAGDAEWKLLNRAQFVVPSPNEYKQLEASTDRLSVKIHDLELTEDYWDETSKHHVDERTRQAVDKVRAFAHIRTPKEIRTHLEDEVKGQSEFNKDPLGTIKSLIQKGLEGQVFTSKDWVLAEMGHAHILSMLDAGKLTAAEMERMTQQKIWLAMYSNEAASEWGRAGSMMRDRVESVKDRSKRAIDKALYAPSERLKRRIGRAKTLKQWDKVKKLRQEWHNENRRVERSLIAKGWDFNQLEKYMGSREAVESFVYEVMREKGEVGTVASIAYEIWVNFILSGPLTHAANISSNILMSAYEFGPKRIAESLLNEVAVQAGLGDKMAPRIGELPHLYVAMGKGFIQGAKYFWRSIVTEDSAFEKALGVDKSRTKIESSHLKQIGGPGSWNRGIGGKAAVIAGRGLRLTGTTFLNAMDSWQKSVNAHAEVVALAYRDAKFQGLVDDQVGQYMDNVINDKSHRLWTDALVKARDTVFQGEPSIAGRAALTVRGTVPGAKWLMPFILTPDNILRKGISYSPLGAGQWGYGVYKGFTEGDWSGMGEKSVQQMIAYSIVLMMLGDDEEEPWITGTVPSQPKEWAGQARSQTIPAMSIKVGHAENGDAIYRSYARIEPFATMLSLSKDIVVMARSKSVNLEEAWFKLTESVVEMTKDKTFLRTVADLSVFLNNPKNGARRIAGGFITSAVPNMYKQIRKASREYKKERRDWGDDGRFEMWMKGNIMKMELPFFEEYDKYDQYGKKIPENWTPNSSHKSSFWYKLLVPAKTKSVHEGVADKILRRWNDQNPDKDRKGIEELDPYFLIKGVRRYLTKPEYEEYTRLTGQVFKTLVDSEAVDIEEPTEGYVENLWNSNWSAARSASQAILKKKWAGLPYNDEAEKIGQQVYQNNINKRIAVLGKPNHVLWKQKPEVMKLPIAKRKQMLDAEQKELLEEKKEAVEWLVQQGYTEENFPRLTDRKWSESRGRALGSFKNLSRGVKGARKRTVPPRVEATR
tara:strand:+ start:1676 stop:7804 length:6129 start_codon:yes stop_codon:yes gene_type:complete